MIPRAFRVAGAGDDVKVSALSVSHTGIVACPDEDPNDPDPNGGECVYDHIAEIAIVHASHLAVVNWGEPEVLDGNRIVITIETAAVPGAADEPEPDENGEVAGVTEVTHQWELGLLEEGGWILTILHDNKRLAHERFVSPVGSGPQLQAKLRTTALDVKDPRHEFHVIYSGGAGVDPASLGNNDIRVIHPITYVIDFEGPIPPCLNQLATFVESDIAADGHSIDAKYVIGCEEGWESFAGSDDAFDVFLVDGAVVMNDGDAVPGRKLGEIPVGDAGNEFRLEVVAHAEPVHEAGKPAVIHATYASKSPLNKDSFGDDDLVIQSLDLNGGGHVPAKLMDCKISDDGLHVEALYHLQPSDGWDETWNGDYSLVLAAGTISNHKGQTNVRQEVGHLFVHIDSGGIPGSASLKILDLGSKVNAVVATELEGFEIHDWGEPILRGSTFFLDAKAGRTDAAVGLVKQRHTYPLLPLNTSGGGETIPFEPIPDEVFFPLYISEKQQFVVRNAKQWEELFNDNWHPLADAGMPDPPVDFSEEMLVGVALGFVPLGHDVAITEIAKDDAGSVVVSYQIQLPGPPPPEGETDNPFAVVSLPIQRLPIRFEESVIAFPSPPVAGDVENDDGEPDPDPNGNPFRPGAAKHYEVVFRVNGETLARTRFVHRDVGGEKGLPSEASIEIARNASGVFADVKVAFEGFPYYQILDWGRARLDGNTYYLPAKSGEVHFVHDPGVIRQHHRYRLVGTGGNSGEPIDFEPLDLENWSALEARNVVIQTDDEWRDTWSSLVPIDGLPPAPPVDLEQFTILGVLQGMKPNGCYDVRITSVVMNANGIVVEYESRVPAPDEGCPEIIVHPQSFVAIPKANLPVTFEEVVAPGLLPRPPIGDRYNVILLVNDQPVARTSFSFADPIPNDRPDFQVAIDASGGMGEAKVTVGIKTEDGLIDVKSWSDLSFEGHRIVADVSLEFTPWRDLLVINPPLPEPAVYTYDFANLAPGFYTFLLKINGRTEGHSLFYVGGHHEEPDLPFRNWLAELLRKVGNASEIGLAEFVGDIDDDGIGDAEEFLLGMNPLKKDRPQIRAEWVPTEENGAGNLAICFQRRKGVEGVRAIVEASKDLHDWHDSPDLFESPQTIDLEGDLEEVIIRLKETLMPRDVEFRFLRLRFEVDETMSGGM